MKNTRIVKQAPDPHMGPAGNSPSNFPIHCRLRGPAIPERPGGRPGGQGQALCGGQEGQDLRRVIPREVHVRGCETQRSGSPGMVPGPRPRRNRVGHEQGLMQDTPRCRGPPSFQTELPVSLQPEATSQQNAWKSAIPPQGLTVLWGETFGDLTPTDALCVLRQVGLQRPSLLRYHEYPAVDAQLSKRCWLSWGSLGSHRPRGSGCPGQVRVGRTAQARVTPTQLPGSLGSLPVGKRQGVVLGTVKDFRGDKLLWCGPSCSKGKQTNNKTPYAASWGSEEMGSDINSSLCMVWSRSVHTI